MSLLSYGIAAADVVAASNLRFHATPLPRDAGLSAGDLVSSTGYVVGYHGRAAGRWDETGAVTDLADPLNEPNRVPSTAFAVNMFGQAAGNFTIDFKDYLPVRWDSRTSVTHLGVILPYTGATPVGPNDLGQAVGVLQKAARPDLPVFWSVDGTATQLPLPAGMNSGIAEGINNSGTVVGYTRNDSTPRQGTKWMSHGSVSLLSLPPNGIDSIPFDVNNSGQIVGWGSINSKSAALEWDSAGNVAVLRQPGATILAAEAHGIDDDGRSVGVIGSSAYLWDADGSPYLLTSLLDSPPGLLDFNGALGIDSSGGAVRVVVSQRGTGEYYLLTAYVPEPRTPIATLFLSLGVFLRERQKPRPAKTIRSSEGSS